METVIMQILPAPPKAGRKVKKPNKKELTGLGIRKEHGNFIVSFN